jgi:hypothetical protein
LTGSGESAVAAGKAIAVNARELRDALDFVSAGEAFDHSAYISLDTGKIYWSSTEAGLGEEDIPQDIDDPDRHCHGKQVWQHGRSRARLAA